MAWIDQHCHIDPGPDGVAQVAEANAAGVMRMVSVGCDLEQSTQMAAIALEHEGVYATAGVHPHEASGGLDGIAELLDLPQVERRRKGRRLRCRRRRCRDRRRR